MIELLAITAVAVAALIVQHFQHRSHERQIDRLLEGFQDERASLLTRIQAPERAVIESFEPNEIRHVPFDDDEAYWKTTEIEQ